MKVIGLFSGIGGFELAFQREGFVPYVKVWESGDVLLSYMVAPEHSPTDNQDE